MDGNEEEDSIVITGLLEGNDEDGIIEEELIGLLVGLVVVITRMGIFVGVMVGIGIG